MNIRWSRSRRALALGLAGAAALVPEAAAQSRLVGYRSASLGVFYENWSFSGGVPQTTRSGDRTVLVDHASQISFPLAATVPVGQNWLVDLSAAYASGRVVLAGPDPELKTDHYTLSGITDARIRAVGRLSPTVSLTFGLNLPTGTTSLDSSEASALRVLGAPALSFQVPRLGSGVSGLAGVIVSRQLGSSWAGAAGLSYEVRGRYDPGAFIPALADPEFSPGDALRLSLGLDGLVGRNGMSLGLSADVYPNHDVIADAGGSGNAFITQLGPVLTADWRLRLAAPRFRELTLYAVDRFRTNFRAGRLRAGESVVSESNGNYLDLGARGILPAGRATGVLAAANFRHQTGLKSDDALATAGVVSGALTLGMVRDLGGGSTVQPFVRGQLGRIKNGAESSTATGLAGGVSVGAKF